ncbi:DUF535 family protein [Helicobacter cetorum]|uniref:DUF535 family protein n=1 Tax=Helicobacter cetorum TaxID=138563 RepID=UPI000CF10E5C|nr:DUF535 family protein [Helicobacter cetorum]
MKIRGGGSYHFHFGLIDDSKRFEGFWGFSINFNNKTLYRINLCLTPNRHLLIGGLQGTKDLDERHYQFFAKYCKTRPNLFLIKLSKELAKFLGCSMVLGIPNEGQISIKNKNQKVFQDYDKLFSGCEATLVSVNDLSYWQIPINEKPIEDYPQKHRAKQRSRRKIIETFKQDLEKVLILNKSILEPLNPSNNLINHVLPRKQGIKIN